MKNLTSLFFLYSGVLISILITCAAVDTIRVGQVIRDRDTLVSADEMYELGFFSPGKSRNRYLGIWYKNLSPQTVVWVANREAPIHDSLGEFRVLTNGSLLVTARSSNTIVWSSNSSLVSPTTINPVAQLLSSGNLVVRGNDDQGSLSFIWQSFDYPSDIMLAGMKFGKDLVSGLDRRYTPWKSPDDPSPSEYLAFLDLNGFPQMVEVHGSLTFSRTGPWNGVTFNGTPVNGPYSVITDKFVFDDKEVYYAFALVNSSVRSHIYMRPDGFNIQRTWNNRTQAWVSYWDINLATCSQFGVCGPNGKCTYNRSPVCSCMEGFEPRNPDEWSASEWSGGCRRRTPLACSNKDGFRVFKNVKLPDTRGSWYNKSMTLDECANACKNNCSCTAYANIDIRTGDGCFLWFDDLLDVGIIDESQDLHVRMAQSDLSTPEYVSPNTAPTKSRKKIIIIVSILSCFVLVSLIIAFMYAWIKRRRALKETADNTIQIIDKEKMTENTHVDDTELSYFSSTEISKATNDFSNSKKLGEGGFGPVYMGMLNDGSEIAVKRLSKTSTQGVNEFKNELKLIAKLQHRNLVKLLGYCNEGDENMLIYEYMPNKSLDLFIFDKVRSLTLNWSERFHIINGIARGLLYLHYDSRFKIVHRDLKASNILLDADMNPKISDFGLARMFRDHENEANTNRVVGTLGYISPEYAIDGKFSEKSDVFSFGVLVLEIISGRKNKGFSHEGDSDNLLAHAWRLYGEGMALELVSAHIRGSCVESEVLRSIHIGLLCVQHHVKDRPTMLSVVLMFDQDSALPPPKQPAFFAKDTVPDVNQISLNQITITTLEPR